MRSCGSKVFALAMLLGIGPLSSFNDVAEKLLVSVFYETLCPHSIRFITEQVYPVYTELSEWIQLDFVPYGKANTTLYSNCSASFTCQHGPDECYGNKVHACALANLESDTRAAFVNCTLSQADSPSAGPFCACQLNVSYARIEECVDSQEGELLLAAHGVLTKNQKPPVQALPWITFKNEFYQQDLEAGLENLRSVVCKHLGMKPPACLLDLMGPAVDLQFYWMLRR